MFQPFILGYLFCFLLCSFFSSGETVKLFFCMSLHLSVSCPHMHGCRVFCDRLHNKGPCADKSLKLYNLLCYMQEWWSHPFLTATESSVSCIWSPIIHFHSGCRQWSLQPGTVETEHLDVFCASNAYMPLTNFAL